MNKKQTRRKRQRHKELLKLFDLHFCIFHIITESINNKIIIITENDILIYSSAYNNNNTCNKYQKRIPLLLLLLEAVKQKILSYPFPSYLSLANQKSNSLIKYWNWILVNKWFLPLLFIKHHLPIHIIMYLLYLATSYPNPSFSSSLSDLTVCTYLFKCFCSSAVSFGVVRVSMRVCVRLRYVCGCSVDASGCNIGGPGIE